MWNAAIEIKDNMSRYEYNVGTLTSCLRVGVVTSIDPAPVKAREGGVRGRRKHGVVLPRQPRHTPAYEGRIVWCELTIQLLSPGLLFVAGARPTQES